MENVYKQVAQILVAQRQSVALAGAGISAESGIPTFRSKGGLWEKYDPVLYASVKKIFSQGPKSSHAV
jgi:NAD-dependent deacetylase